MLVIITLAKNVDWYIYILFGRGFAEDRVSKTFQKVDHLRPTHALHMASVHTAASEVIGQLAYNKRNFTYLAVSCCFLYALAESIQTQRKKKFRNISFAKENIANMAVAICNEPTDDAATIDSD